MSSGNGTEPIEVMRARLLAPSRERVTVEHNGEKFDVLEPSLKQRDEYLRLMSMQTEGDKVTAINGRPAEAQCYLVAELTVLHATETRLFLDADRKMLEEAPVGGLIASLSRAAQEFLGKKKAAAKGNDSKATESAS